MKEYGNDAPGVYEQRELWTSPSRLVIATLAASPAHAQMNGEHLLEDLGVVTSTFPVGGIKIGPVTAGSDLR